MNASSGKTAVVVGASRGLGRGIAVAFADSGASVIAVARSTKALSELELHNARIQGETADATDPVVAWSIIDKHDPDILVLNAGANPVMRPLQHQTWETFSANWETDVRIAFNWLRESLLKPLKPGSSVIVISSGAALFGSPASGGYAGAKATERFIAAYAREESQRADLGITVTAIMPRMTPNGDIGKRGVRAYAARNGQTEAQYIKELGPLVTPELAGSALVQLIASPPAEIEAAYVLTGHGLQKLS